MGLETVNNFSYPFLALNTMYELKLKQIYSYIVDDFSQHKSSVNEEIILKLLKISKCTKSIKQTKFHSTNVSDKCLSFVFHLTMLPIIKPKHLINWNV
ncbi:CLUMA_CG003503, isoform A [Clunio marinus]|uniref:CLUMA_CG003503, isoform A n=1 Tax=Clunio marinus TaxID=568069 RepID=A0A1J1HNU8_9DIPT|nr:CLUMA_CG003503, isoform A [Clunio marinus]